VPGSDDDYTWTISGCKPGHGQEISYLLITGCWTRQDIVSVNASAGKVEIRSDGSVKIDNLRDKDLPLSVTIVFNKTFSSGAGQVSIFVKTGGGRGAGFSFTVAGPICGDVAGAVQLPNAGGATPGGARDLLPLLAGAGFLALAAAAGWLARRPGLS
jgi:hypothetical protein